MTSRMPQVKFTCACHRAEHTIVKAYWSLRFEKDPGRPIVDEVAATYVLRRQEGPWQIVFQLDHQDLTKRLQELGLVS